MTSSAPGRPDELGAVLDRLTAAGTPWLALVPAVAVTSGYQDDAIVLDLTDSRYPPLTIDPFRPAPGCPVQAHADRLAALLEAVFRPPRPVRVALRLALRRVYADRGWDIVAGTALPGAVAPPGIPSVADLGRGMLAAVTDLGGYASMRAQVRGFAATLAAVWSGPAGRFLAGGHPAGVPELLRQNVLFTVGEVADDEAAAFLAGTLLLSVTEHLGAGVPAPGAVVLAVPADCLSRPLTDIRRHGAEVVHAKVIHTGAGQSGHAPATTDGCYREGVLSGRRSAACGPLCRQRPCSGHELHAAVMLARADGQVWLRLWAQVVVLAFLTGRPLPGPPARVRRAWLSLDARTRECLLATVVHAAVAERASALRHSYDPPDLSAAVASTATRLLSPATLPSENPGLRRAGPVWVIPQLRWLHETEHLLPLGRRQMRAEDIAPPLDFALAGLADWPGIRVGDRLDGLRRHRWSMDTERNRRIATTALLGGDEVETTLTADLATAGTGLHPGQRLRHAARMLGAAGRGQEPGWLEVVLSWPSRLIQRGETRSAAG